MPSSEKEIILSVRGLTKVFKDFWGRPRVRAVDNVEFDVRKGEIFGLLGPNGSGKSTTVKMILGLLNPTRGQIRLFGHSPRHVKTKGRVGYLPEESYLYRYLDSSETLDFFGSLFDLAPEERKRRSRQLVNMVGLANASNRLVGEFSKGMQRRIGLAQALINDPDLVILDEPTAGLDPIGCREVKDLILALSRRGKTILLSSHLLADVEEICHRVVIYYGGRIRAEGSLRQLLANPDKLQITMPTLSREATERILEIIRSEAAQDKVRIGAPSKNLESYFLDVIERARKTDQLPAGAIAGSGVAAYLRGEAETGSVANAVLERLTKLEPEIPVPKATVEPSSTLKVDEEKLESLSHPEEKREASQPVEIRPSIDLSKANEKLSGLLNKKS